MPHSHTLTARVSTTWTISRPLSLRVCVGAFAADGGPHTDCCCSCCIPVKSAIVTWHHSNTHGMQGHRSAKTIQTVTGMLAVVVVVNTLTLTYYQCTDLGYSFVSNFRCRLICESLILARFSATGMGVGLYVGRLIREYIRYAKFHWNPSTEYRDTASCKIRVNARTAASKHIASVADSSMVETEKLRKWKV